MCGGGGRRGLQGQRRAASATVDGVTAARDIAAGTVVRPGDLTRTSVRPGVGPRRVLAGAAAASGRTTAGPLRAGEPITDVRLLTSSLLDGYPGLVAVAGPDR